LPWPQFNLNGVILGNLNNHFLTSGQQVIGVMGIAVRNGLILAAGNKSHTAAFGRGR
jgi:hypothetical protein